MHVLAKLQMDAGPQQEPPHTLKGSHVPPDEISVGPPLKMYVLPDE